MSPAPPETRSAAGRIADPAWVRAALFAAFTALVALRIPGIWQGRFWAEDGLFLLDALRLPWHEALLRPHTGYLDLVASTTMLLATRLVTLEDAPFVSLAISLCIQVLPGLLLAAGGIRWMPDPRYLAAALLMLATVPLSEEVWLSPITSQYHLIVAVGVVLASETSRGWTRWLHRAVLLIAPLAGPGPSLAAPLFFLRAMADCSWARFGQGVLISMGTLAQVAVLLSNPEAHRDIGIAPDLLLMVITVKHILVPLLGRTESIDLSKLLWAARHAGSFTALPLLAMTAAAAALLVLGIAAWRSRTVEARWLYFAAVLTMLLSYVGSLGPKEALLGILFGQRYYVAPQMLFSLTLIAVAAGASGPGRKVAAGLAGWLIIVGVHACFSVDPLMADGPSWRAQVAAWRTDPRAPIALWPYGFQIKLPKREP